MHKVSNSEGKQEVDLNRIRCRRVRRRRRIAGMGGMVISSA